MSVVPTQWKKKKIVPIQTVTVDAKWAASSSEATKYPDAHAESTTVDGYTEYLKAGQTWATVHDADGSSDCAAYPSAATGRMAGLVTASQGPPQLYWAMYRSHFLFDLSSIPAGSFIVSAVFSIYGTAKTKTTSYDEGVNVYQGSPASNTDLVAADYQKARCGGDSPAAFSTKIANASWDTAGWNAFAFNNAGRAYLATVTGGIAKLCVRGADYDAPNITPAGSQNFKECHVSGEFADNASNKPKLVITYLPANVTDAPAYYKLPIIVHRGTPLVERVDKTVAGRFFRYRLSFWVKANSALFAGFSGIDVVIDTKKLIARGSNYYFGGTDVSYASTVEFVQRNGDDDTTNTCKYCLHTKNGAVWGWNTDCTQYVLRIPLAVGERVDALFHMYFDSNRTEQSSNYKYGQPESTEQGAWNFYQDFSVAATDIDDFVNKYTYWEKVKSGGNDAAVTVAAGTSILNLQGGSASQYAGVRVKSGSFSTTDCRIRIGFATHAPDSQARAGMCSPTAGSFTTSSVQSTGITDQQITIYRSAPSSTTRAKNYEADTFWEFLFGDGYFENFMLGDRAASYPPFKAPYYESTGLAIAMDDVAYVPFACAYGDTPHQHIDFIAVGDRVPKMPSVYVPNILYDEDGIVFAEGACGELWPYNMAITGYDGTTELAWTVDERSERSRHPGYAIELTIRTTSLAEPVCFYFDDGETEGNPGYNIDSQNPACNPATVYGDSDCLWDSFDSSTFASDDSGTYKAIGGGTWAAADVMEPIFRRGEVGAPPHGGGGGRTMSRLPNVVEWESGKYIKVSCGCTWESESAFWPLDFSIQISFSSSPIGPWSPARTAFRDPSRNAWNGSWPLWAGVHGTGANKKLYVAYYATTPALADFVGIASCADPYADAPVWTINTNNLFTDTWLHGTGQWDNDDSMYPLGFQAVHDGTKWRIVYEVKRAAPDNDYVLGYCYTTANPENWTSGSFTDVGLLLDPGAYWEDYCLFYDGVSTWTIVGWMYPISAGFTAWDSTDFSYWGTHYHPDLEYGPWGNNTTWLTGSRLLKVGSDIFFYFSAQPRAETESYRDKYLPNYLGVGKASGMQSTFTGQNKHKKAQLTNTTGTHIAYHRTFDAARDFEYISEAMSKVAGGETRTGLLFRYDPTAQTGYAAFLNWNGGDPLLSCWKVEANALVAFSPAKSYTIPIFPLPRFYPGFAWRLYVKCYKHNIKIGYSPWGNEVVWGLNFTDYLYAGTRIGLMANAAASWWDRSRFRPIVQNVSGVEPSPLQAAEADLGMRADF